jgi:hypothetical protein
MEWRDIQDSLYYEVSDTGLVRNKRSKRILVQSSNGKGIFKVLLAEDGDLVTKSVARLVGEAFVDGYDEGDVIFYIDDDRTNMHASNLQWRPRWFAQEWAYQLNRVRPMRPWSIKMNSTGEIFENTLECAKATYGIEKYIVLACIRGNQIYNHSTYEWVRK